MIRFENLLPLFYNDGRAIEAEKFLATDDDLVQRFSATSTDHVIVRGQWKNKSALYSDQLIRVRVDVEDTTDNQDAMRTLKETLKVRFEQLDIWITAIPFTDSEELTKTSRPTSIEVGSDHRLADQEPLAVMLQACEAVE